MDIHTQSQTDGHMDTGSYTETQTASHSGSYIQIHIATNTATDIQTQPVTCRHRQTHRDTGGQTCTHEHTLAHGLTLHALADMHTLTLSDSFSDQEQDPVTQMWTVIHTCLHIKLLLFLTWLTDWLFFHYQQLFPTCFCHTHTARIHSFPQNTRNKIHV